MDNSIEDLINTVVDQDFSKSGPMFSEIMQDKMSDAIEQEKIAIAGQVFNGEEPEEEQLELDLDDDVEDITDEELDDAIDELEDDVDELEDDVDDEE